MFEFKHIVLVLRYEAFFNKPDIDGWEIRKAMNDLSGMDLVPEPKIINAALRACRRVNDYALAVRYLPAINTCLGNALKYPQYLESLRFKCGDLESKIYPYIIQEITPTLNELGIDTPEKLGYDKPELALKSVYDM
ncbi:unnamed protein product [Nesidiocoris tenuis]|uniref:Cytochrome c oxidase subunit 5A, mitochondrial n=1 Tax=Nesidiocoris tenuis TaxID=355587 RepID=A0A6H5G156_9HEMI|nr:unnamed protein product [Nesidiocoris tenuis]